MPKGTRSNPRRSVIILGALALGMFAFAFALVPLYQVFCEVTGLNGKTAGAVAAAPAPEQRASERAVTIQFVANVGNGMPWEFRPTEHQLEVTLGEIRTTEYYARNRAAQAVIGQAVPSVAPGYAARYLHKVECFCFTQQRLDAGETQHMPVRFYVADDLPDEVRTLTLSYTLYRVPQGEAPARTGAGG